MTTIQTADGKLLRSTKPAGASLSPSGGGIFPTLGPMWSTGDQDHDDDGLLRSYEQIYRSQPLVAGVVDKLARRIATLPFHAYRSLKDGEREMVRGDGLDDLIREPLPRSDTVALNYFIAQSLLVHGNAVVAKLRPADRDDPPFALWPLNWAQMSAYGPTGGHIEWWSTTQFEGEERFIAAEDTIHFAWPSPSGSAIGVSPLEKLGTTIRLEDAALRHQTSMFKNGSRPSLAVSLEQQRPTKDMLDYARSRVEAMHKGPDNSGRTFFMGANVKLQPLSLSPVEAALIDQRKLNREEVGMVFDLSGPMMNDLSHGTMANVQEMLKSLYRDVLPPWLGLIEGTYRSQLLAPEPAWTDRFVAFDLTDKLKGDPKELAESLKLQVEGGLTKRNEARRILNLPPDGDPNDPNNPANQLTANTNNQATIEQMNTGGDVPPAL